MLAPVDYGQLHRQFRRCDRRMCQRPTIEKTSEDRYASLRASSRYAVETQDEANAAEGDRIIVVVQKQRNFGSDSDHKSISIGANKVRRGDIRHAVVVRTAKKLQRPDGSVVRFDDNACVLINKAGEPIGTRLNGEC